MSDSYIGPNLRGTAGRSHDKDKRMATHTNVIKSLIVQLSPQLVIEHGMGKSSTPLFHELNVPHVISLEDNEAWRGCGVCEAGRGSNKHTIMTYADMSEKDIWSSLDPATTFLFLDGPDNQRQALFDIATQHGVAVIIEHDAESFSLERIDYIKRLGTKRGYVLRQYIKENPETGLYVHASKIVNIELNDYVDL